MKENIAQVNFPSREVVTANQIANLVNIGSVCLAALLNPKREQENIPGTGPSLTGEAATAAEATFINVCNQLDNLLKDNSRWNLELQKQLESECLETIKLHQTFLQEQANASKMLSTPSFRFKPELCKLSSGRWAAVLGDPNHFEESLVGIGNSPEAALADFDIRFASPLSEILTPWLLQREEDLLTGQPLSPYPKLHEETLDTKRSKHPKKAKGPKENLPGDSSVT